MRMNNHPQTNAKKIMGIQQICNSIKGLFEKVRSPFPQLPRLPLVCALPKRPGLSAIHSTGNIVQDLNTLGIPTGSMPDGSANLTVGFVYAIIKEMFRALKEDASGQGGFTIGSIQIIVSGSNGGGPFTARGFNTSTGELLFTIC